MAFNPDQVAQLVSHQEERISFAGRMLPASRLDTDLQFRLLPVDYLNGLLSLHTTRYYFQMLKKPTAILNHASFGYPDLILERKHAVQAEGDESAVALLAQLKPVDEFWYPILVLKNGKPRKDIPIDESIKILQLNMKQSKLLNELALALYSSGNVEVDSLYAGVTILLKKTPQGKSYNITFSSLGNGVDLTSILSEDMVVDMIKEGKDQLKSERYVDSLLEAVLYGTDPDSEAEKQVYRPKHRKPNAVVQGQPAQIQQSAPPITPKQTQHLVPPTPGGHKKPPMSALAQTLQEVEEDVI